MSAIDFVLITGCGGLLGVKDQSADSNDPAKLSPDDKKGASVEPPEIS